MLTSEFNCTSEFTFDHPYFVFFLFHYLNGGKTWIARGHSHPVQVSSIIDAL